MTILKKSHIDGKLYDGDISMQQAATADLGTVLSAIGARVAGTAYPITTSGAVALTGDVTITDKNIALGTSTGTKIGTATSQKLAFFNSTPIVQVGATIDPGVVLSNLGLRAAGTAYTITTSGDVALSGVTTTGETRTTYGNGAAVAGKCTAVSYGVHPIHQTVLTLTLTGANDLDLADGDHGTGIKIYDMPAGRILILGATINADIAYVDAATTGEFVVSVGQAVGADDATLTSTEADIIPSTAIAGAATPKAWHAALAASAQFDGTATALPIYVNVACPNASNSATAQTYAITGTLTISWINLGDY
jgi:hypothetical protein